MNKLMKVTEAKVEKISRSEGDGWTKWTYQLDSGWGKREWFSTFDEKVGAAVAQGDLIGFTFSQTVKGARVYNNIEELWFPGTDQDRGRRR